MRRAAPAGYRACSVCRWWWTGKGKDQKHWFCGNCRAVYCRECCRDSHRRVVRADQAREAKGARGGKKGQGKRKRCSLIPFHFCHRQPGPCPFASSVRKAAAEPCWRRVLPRSRRQPLLTWRVPAGILQDIPSSFTCQQKQQDLRDHSLDGVHPLHCQGNWTQAEYSPRSW